MGKIVRQMDRTCQFIMNAIIILSYTWTKITSTANIKMLWHDVTHIQETMTITKKLGRL